MADFVLIEDGFNLLAQLLSLKIPRKNLIFRGFLVVIGANIVALETEFTPLEAWD